MASIFSKSRFLVQGKVLNHNVAIIQTPFINKTSKRSFATEPIALKSLKKGTGGRSSFNGLVVTVFGASSYLGRTLVSILGRTGTQVILPYRGDPYFMKDFKVMGDLGQILYVPFHLEDEDSLRKAMRHSNVVINCIGKDIDTRCFTMQQTNVDGAARIARISKEMGVDHLVHVSALAQTLNPETYIFKPCEYLKTKALGEKAVLEERPDATIFRPSDMWGVDDKFLCYYISGVRRCGYSRTITLPLWGMGKKTIKQPVWVNDVAQGMVNSLVQPNSKGQIYEAVGPHRYRLDDLVKWIYYQCRYLPHEVIISPIYHPTFLARVMISAYTTQLYPHISMGRLNREFPTDTVSGCPTLEDLGVKLNKLEDRLHNILYMYTKEKYYWDALGEFPDPPNPPLSPV